MSVQASGLQQDELIETSKSERMEVTSKIFLDRSHR